MSTILYLTQIQLDFCAVKLLAAECQRIGIKRPLVITDAGVKAAGVLQKALDALADLPVTVFDQTPPNPTEASVRAAHEVWQASGADGLIAVGGGSSIDLAKGLAIMATHPGPLKTYATIEGGSSLITAQAAPLIAVPTTAGTGSEVARGAIIIVDDGRKLGFHSWNLMPKAAICDPELTLGLPPMLTAATGMDAIAHCMETFMSPAFNPPADGIALDGLERMASAMGLASASDIPDAIRDMNARLGLPTGLAAMGVEASAFEKIIKGALADHCHKTNPRLASAADYEVMLEQSM